MKRLFHSIGLIAVSIGWHQPLAAQRLASRATATVMIRVSVAPRFRIEARGVTIKIVGSNLGSALPFTVDEVTRGASQANSEARLFLIVPE